MKKNLILVIIILVLLLPALSTPSFVSAVDSGGATLVMGTTDSVESAIDPARAWDFFGWEIIQNTGCGLVETEPATGDIMPSLATSWSLTPDGLTWTFNLRQGIYFDDNATEFNATHVKYSFDRSMGIASPDGPQLGMEYDAIIDSVEVVSKYVVQFILKIPFAPFLRLMACPASFIVNPVYAPFDQVVYYTEGNVRASTPMDLGPYKLTKWEQVAGADEEMWLEANPNYWRSNYPKTEKIIIKFYADATPLRLAIEAGDIDVAFRHISATDIEDLQDDPNLKVWEGTGAAIQYMIFQEDPVGTLPQLDDARIRRALTACLNRSEVCTTVLLGQASPLYSIIPNGMLGHTEAFAVLGDANYTYAVSELADLGYSETNKLEIELWYESSGHYPSSAEQAAVYKEQFEDSGVISVTLHSLEWSAYREARSQGTMHVFLYGWYPDYIDPDNYAFLYYAAWLNHHYIDYGEHYGEMKAAYDAARTTTNEVERIALYAEIDDYAVMDCPVVPLWQGKTFAVTKLIVKGVYLDITQSWRMWYLYSTVEASIYIRADGSVDPPTANITSVDNVTYIFTGNIIGDFWEQAITVQKNNIVVDGAGHTLQGTEALGSRGIDLTGRSNITIKNMEIKAFYCGIRLDNSSDCTVSGNNITENDWQGIFLLDSSNNNVICGNNITANNSYGMWLAGSNNSVYGNNIIGNNDRGIGLYYSSNNTIYENNITNNNYYGISLYYSSSNAISGNNIAKNNRDGIYLGDSTDNAISGNNITANNEYGVWLHSSSNNTISGNNITNNNEYGIILEVSSNNTISGNIITENGWDGIRVETSNYNSVSGNNVTNNWYGIELVWSSNNSVSKNNITNNRFGIGLYRSFNNSVFENKLAANNERGIGLSWSSNNSVSKNTITKNNEEGIWLGIYSSNNTVSGNNVTNNNDGIWLEGASSNIISGNTITNNELGIRLYQSSNNTLRNNFVNNKKYNFDVYGSELEHYIHDMDDSNTLDGKPVYYWVNRRDLAVPLDAGYVALVNCTNITVQNLNLNNNGQGVLLASTTNSTISKNNLTNNCRGISLYCSSNNTMGRNNITANEYYGIRLDWSSNNTIYGNAIARAHYGYGIILSGSDYNTIYHNNIIDNSIQVVTFDGYPNDWDDGYPSGGNYWSDYEERYPNATEIDDSGIWDTPYVIDDYNQDNYPLMNPYFPLPGDLNDDGTINIIDVIVLAGSFGSEPGDPNWNPDADMNNDSIINILDAILIAGNFGKTS